MGSVLYSIRLTLSFLPASLWLSSLLLHRHQIPSEPERPLGSVQGERVLGAIESAAWATSLFQRTVGASTESSDADTLWDTRRILLKLCPKLVPHSSRQWQGMDGQNVLFLVHMFQSKCSQMCTYTNEFNECEISFSSFRAKFISTEQWLDQ